MENETLAGARNDAGSLDEGRGIVSGVVKRIASRVNFTAASVKSLDRPVEYGALCRLGPKSAWKARGRSKTGQQCLSNQRPPWSNDVFMGFERFQRELAGSLTFPGDPDFRGILPSDLANGRIVNLDETCPRGGATGLKNAASRWS